MTSGQAVLGMVLGVSLALNMFSAAVLLRRRLEYRHLRKRWLAKSGEQGVTFIPLPSRCTCCPEHGQQADDVPLLLTGTGPGSRPEILDYLKTVIEQNTTTNADITPERLAHAMLTSVLHRLGSGFTAAVTGHAPAGAADV